MTFQIKIKTIILAGLIFAYGCSSGVQMSKPLTEQLSYDSVIAAQYSADKEWWKIYDDPQLDQLIEIALQNNLDLAKSAININRALYRVNLLSADLVPSFSGGLSGSVKKNLRYSDPSVNSFSGELSVQYEIDLWHKLADSVSAQEWEYEATIEDEAATRLALINSIINAYYQLAYINEAILVREENIENYRKIKEIIQAKYDLGKVDALELAQANQSLLSAESSLIDLQTREKETREILCNLLNLRPDQPLNIDCPELLSVISPGVDLNVPLAVLANRPDLLAAENRLQRAFIDVQAATKDWYPTINIGAAISSSSDRIRTTFDVPFTSGTIRINLPFLQWNTIKWQVKISEADFERARLDFEQSITTALNEVDTYYFWYIKAKDSLSTIKEKYDYDIKISQYYNVRYDNGSSELSDWLNSINTEISSRLSLLNAHYTVIQYENTLYKAMAGRYQAAWN